LTSSLLPLRLQLGCRLSRGFPTLGLLPRGFLAFGLLPRGFDAGRLLTSSLLPRRRLRRSLLLNGSLLRLRDDSLLHCITGIATRGHDGLRAGYAWRCGDVRRWRRWSRGHDQLGLVGGLHVDDGRFRDLSGRRVGGPFGARGRFRSVRIGRGVLLWLGFCRGPGRGNDR
jgi:hypothetical protein